MRIECVKEKLQKGVSLTERIVGKNLSLPILSSIYLEAKNKNLLIRATNLDIGIEIKIPSLIEKEGCVAVKPSILNAFLNNINQADKIKLETENNNISVITKNSSTLIKCEVADDFPLIPVANKNDGVKISAIDFVKGLKSVSFAASISDIKPEISSVYIYQEGDSLCFVSTDSFRLAERKIKLNQGLNFKPIIIPFKNAIEIIRVLEDIKETIDIYTDDNQVSIHTIDFFITSRLVSGIYPDYRQIMPKKIQTTAHLNKEDILPAFKLSQIFINKLNQVLISTDSHTQTMSIKSQNQDVGENIITIPAEIKGPDISVGFNAKYISDVFNVISQDKLSFSFDEVRNRLLIETIPQTDFNYLVMPLNR